MSSLFDIFLSCIYIGCCVYAVYRGHQKFFVVLALMLALVFQYVLGFSDLAKIIVAAIFVLYFGMSNVREFSRPQWSKEKPASSKRKSSAASNDTGGGSQSGEGTGATPESVFEEFQQFSDAQNHQDTQSNRSKQ